MGESKPEPTMRIETPRAVDIDAGGAQHRGSDVVRSRLVALDRLVHELVAVGR
jgi:hypothetical protein